MRRDAVTAKVRREVLDRDGICFGARIDPRHICADQWGLSHLSTRQDLLTVDHVKEAGMMGRRAPSDPAHLVAMCWWLNTRPPSKEVREAERSYLASLYPAEWGRRKRDPVSCPGDPDPAEVPELAAIVFPRQPR